MGLGGLPGVRVAGKVTRSTVVLDHDSRMLRIDVHCTNPVDVIDLDRQIELQPGMFCTVTVMLRHWGQPAGRAHLGRCQRPARQSVRNAGRR